MPDHEIAIAKLQSRTGRGSLFLRWYRRGNFNACGDDFDLALGQAGAQEDFPHGLGNRDHSIASAPVFPSVDEPVAGLKRYVPRRHFRRAQEWTEQPHRSLSTSAVRMNDVKLFQQVKE